MAQVGPGAGLGLGGAQQIVGVVADHGRHTGDAVRLGAQAAQGLLAPQHGARRGQAQHQHAGRAQIAQQCLQRRLQGRDLGRLLAFGRRLHAVQGGAVQARMVLQVQRAQHVVQQPGRVAFQRGARAVGAGAPGGRQRQGVGRRLQQDQPAAFAAITGRRRCRIHGTHGAQPPAQARCAGHGLLHVAARRAFALGGDGCGRGVHGCGRRWRLDRRLNRHLDACGRWRGDRRRCSRRRCIRRREGRLLHGRRHGAGRRRIRQGRRCRRIGGRSQGLGQHGGRGLGFGQPDSDAHGMQHGPLAGV
ncbi:MAG: hypothetical protein GAK34_01610 [Delftia tsuruhatensis]|nr:MAG: hypothetical protein GAK34_01610 [Delftia tsuruhatensis]